MLEPQPRPPARKAWRLAVIGASVTVLLLLFGYTGGWLTPGRLTAHRLVDALQRNAGLHPGYRRNHAKGICVTGYFESRGNASAYSRASVFAPGRTPVVGRFAIPGGNPDAPDGGTPVRSMALRFDPADGQQWRTGMNNSPVFPVATPQAFYELLVASRADPATGKPDPAKLSAFYAAHPETSAFRAWARATTPSSSYATQRYYGLDAFYLVDAGGRRHPVRWSVRPEVAESEDGATVASPDGLAEDLRQRLASGPLRWHLILTLAAPDDPTNDATRAWPPDRHTIDAGILVIEQLQPQDSGPCRDVNYDPTVLPNGIAVSDDPLLPARSAAYANSYLRRTSEEARIPGAARAERQP